MTPASREELTNRLKFMLRELDQLIHSQIGNSERLPFVGCAFVTFASEIEKERFIQAYEIARGNRSTKPTFKVRRAALPTDIIWDNYEPVQRSKVLKKWLFVLLAAFIIFLAFANLLSLNIWVRN